MSEQVTVDSLDFARSGKQLGGEAGIANLDRLHDRLASTDGVVQYELTGYTDGQGKPRLHCRVRGTLNLICQRCLQPMEWKVNLDSDLVLVTSESELVDAEDDPEAPDRLLARKDMNVRELVEDELLLGLPLAPKHPEGQCLSTASREQGGELSPFATLAKLKPGRH
jgi:uncharacterized protein